MIANIKKGQGFKGVLSYAICKESASLITHNLASKSDSPRDLAREFRSIVKLGAVECTKPVFHASLSSENEHLSDEKWIAISDDFLSEMGFGNTPFALIRHGDTDHDHVHVIASRIDFDGKLISDSNDFKKANRACELIERKHGLAPDPHQKNEHKNENPSELSISIDAAIENYLEAAAREHGKFVFSVRRFSNFCENHGVRVQQNKGSRGGTIRGLSFASSSSPKSKAISGGKIRRDLTLHNIKKRFTPTQVRCLRKAAQNDQMKKIIEDITAIATREVLTSYGCKFRLGNQTAVVIDGGNRLKVLGISDEKMKALLALKSASDRGWDAVEISGLTAETTKYIEVIAAKNGIQVNPKEPPSPHTQEETKASAADVLRGRASLGEFKTSKEQQNTSKTTQRGRTR